MLKNPILKGFNKSNAGEKKNTVFLFASTYINCRQ